MCPLFLNILTPGGCKDEVAFKKIFTMPHRVHMIPRQDKKLDSANPSTFEIFNKRSCKIDTNIDKVIEYFVPY